MRSTFRDSLSEFRQLLEKNGYPLKLEWVTPQDVLLSGGRLIYIKIPIPDSNVRDVCQLFDQCANKERGILLGTICVTRETTYAYAWSPSDPEQAERVLMKNEVKMSVNTGLGRVPGEAVQSRLRWLYLRVKLRRKQQEKHHLFGS